MLFAQSVMVETMAGDELANPWGGGLNACQFGRIDLDGDGVKDLVVFDRTENKVLCFRNMGAYNTISFQYSPQYDTLFPPMTDWMILADYDGDGYEDIFTYSKGLAGIRVYKNNGTFPLGFQLVVTDYLTSQYSAGEVNILATDADYPAIVDIDCDGDLDIVTFGVLGVFLEKHTNLSKELYGNADSLLFEFSDPCWGKVAENEENNIMYLDTCLFGKNVQVSRGDFRHRGAALTLRDLNNDGYFDLLISDSDYPEMSILYGGQNESGFLFVNQNDVLPGNNLPVNLVSMPCAFFTDVNNDGIDDLLVSVFAPDVDKIDGKNSIHLYINHGSNELPSLVLETTSFLQNQMIDVGMNSVPFFYDVDNDGLVDVVVGNRGDVTDVSLEQGSLALSRGASLCYYRNVGTASSPAYRIEDYDFGLLFDYGATHLCPAFADVDNDGNDELVVGTAEGNLLLLEKIDGQWRLVDDNYLSVNGKRYTAPCFCDVDNDGFLDLVLGNRTGKLSLYKGNATDNGVAFQLVDDFYGDIDVCDHDVSFYGYSKPTFFEFGGQKFLAVGAESGRVRFYEINASGRDFSEVIWPFDNLSNYFKSNIGNIGHSSVCIKDINDDDIPDIMVGNLGGGLMVSLQANVFESLPESDGTDFSLFPNPTSDKIEIQLNEDVDCGFQVFDMMGTQTMTGEFYGRSHVVDVSSFVSGVYFFFVRTPDSFSVRKFVVR